MNSRQLTFILVAAIVLGAIGWFLFHRGESSWQGATSSHRGKVLEFPLNDVAAITINDGSSILHLLKKNGDWVVQERADYPASFEQVRGLLQKVWELKPVETLQVGASQLGRFDLTQPAKDKKGATLLDLKNAAGKSVATLLAGKQFLKQSSRSYGPGTYPAGRYVMAENRPNEVFLVADAMSDLITKPERWLDRDFLKIVKPKSIVLDGPSPKQKWTLERKTENGPWEFAQPKAGEQLEQAKVTRMAANLASLSFVDLLGSEAKPETVGLDKPTTVVIETFAGFTYTLHFGALREAKYPLTVSLNASLPNDKPAEKKALEEKLAREKKFEGRIFLVSQGAAEQLMPKRSELLKATPSPAPAVPGMPPGAEGVPPLMQRPALAPSPTSPHKR